MKLIDGVDPCITTTIAVVDIESDFLGYLDKCEARKYAQKI